MAVRFSMRWMLAAMTVACGYAATVAAIGWADPTFVLFLASPVPFALRMGLRGIIPAGFTFYVGWLVLLFCLRGEGYSSHPNNEDLGIWIFAGLPIACGWSAIVATIVDPYWRQLEPAVEGTETKLPA